MKYRTIVADPPWKVHRPVGWKNARYGSLPYRTMGIDEISALPVDDLAADIAHLYLWTINRYVEDAYDIARAWGFAPATLLVWCKEPLGLGAGGHFAQMTEYVLFARRGIEGRNPERRSERNWWTWRRGDHSAKPEAFLDIVEQVSLGPRLEMFARRARFGWDYWGDESLQTVDLTQAAESAA